MLVTLCAFVVLGKQGIEKTLNRVGIQPVTLQAQDQFVRSQPEFGIQLSQLKVPALAVTTALVVLSTQGAGVASAKNQPTVYTLPPSVSVQSANLTPKHNIDQTLIAKSAQTGIDDSQTCRRGPGVAGVCG